MPRQKGYKVSEETKKRISEANRGKKRTPEQIEKWRQSRKGYSPTEETRKRLSEAGKGNKNSLGCKHSEETRRKMSEAAKGKIFSEKHRMNLSRAMKERDWSKVRLSEEHKNKISKAHKGKWQGHHHIMDGKTDAEAYFHSLMPHLEVEKVFRTGGRKLWGCTWFKADFVDEESMTVYEIDGTSHRGRKERDERKDAFFQSLGYKVIRYKNDQVLSMGI